MSEDLCKFLEHIPEEPIGDNVLTDEDLRKSGLIKAEAFVRTKSGKAALRAKRYRERKIEEGLKPLNVLAPIELHEKIKAFAKNGKLPDDDSHKECITKIERNMIAFGKHAQKLPLWRQWVILVAGGVKMSWRKHLDFFIRRE